MKLLSILLLCYIFLLCTIPCKDECTFSNSVCISIQYTAHASSCENGQQKCHTCSPFCFCNCCQVNTITSVLVANQLIQTFYGEQNIIYIEKKIDPFHTSIWQPPKLS